MKTTNLILICIDDLRFDCVGYEKDKRLLSQYDVHNLIDTPTLDGLARSGVRFTHCVSTSSYTPPSIASILTGAYPKNNKVKTFFNKLSQGVRTLAEILSNKNFETYAWIEHPPLEMLDLTRGIKHIMDPFKDNDANLFSFLNSIEEGEKFIFIHLFDVHKPYGYTTGGSEREKYNDGYLEMIEKIAEKIDVDVGELLEDAKKEAARVVNNYQELNASLREYANFRSLDYLLREKLREFNMLFEEIIPLYMKGVSKFDKGRFHDLVDHLDEMGFLDNSLLIVTADHGETRCRWKEREDFMNSFNLQESSVRVPLIMLGRDMFPGEIEVEKNVSAIDIAPTVTDAFDINTDVRFDGKSLMPLITEEPDGWDDRLIFSETWAYEGGVDIFGNINQKRESFLSQVSVRTSEYKYVRSATQIGYPEHMLFNVIKDPYEDVNLFNDPAYEELSRQLMKKLDDYVKDMGDLEEVSGDEERRIRERLRALGYI